MLVAPFLMSPAQSTATLGASIPDDPKAVSVPSCSKLDASLM